jgi:hypothetical protein
LLSDRSLCAGLARRALDAARARSWEVVFDGLMADYERVASGGRRLAA